MRVLCASAFLGFLALSGCSTGPADRPAADSRACNLSAATAPEAGPGCARAWIDANLKMNDIQTLGTHNSYKDWIAPSEFRLFVERAPKSAPSLEYAHEPLPAQLAWGIRQFEIDVVHDPKGGTYLDPLLRREALKAGMSTPELAFKDELSRPGFKVMHVPDLDYRTTCPTLIACLTQLREWSSAHPDHTPIFVMLNIKDTPASWPGAAPVAQFDTAAWDALDTELLSVLPREALITPAELKGDQASVREGVLANNWPTLGKARGRLLFGILGGETALASYLGAPGGIAARPMFPVGKTTDAHAAWVMWDDPIVNQEAIRRAVAEGFIVRTRTEQDTVEPRVNSTGKRTAAFASSGQYVSTDYYRPNPNFGPYAVALPGGGIARCNPIRAAARCGDVPIE